MGMLRQPTLGAKSLQTRNNPLFQPPKNAFALAQKIKSKKFVAPVDPAPSPSTYR